MRTRALHELIRLPLRLIPTGAVLPVLRGPHRGMKWIVSSGVHAYWLGNYESSTRRLFEQFVKPGSTVIDIGANVGFYTLMASALAGREGRVIACEPLPRNLNYLRDHLRLNRIANVQLIEAAVSDRAGLAGFRVAAHPAMGALAPEGILEVPTITLDDLCEQLDVRSPDVIKIDVEGGELAVLRGGRNTLSMSRPTVLLSTHGRESHQACRSLLHDLGYRTELVKDGEEDGMYELIATKEGR